MDFKILTTYLIGFIIIAIAANQIAKVFQKIKFPLITGLIITGIIAGSSVLNFITPKAIDKLNFLNQIALAIIAFSAGSELYLNDLRSRIHTIKWMTIGQLIITFVLTTICIYYGAKYIPFMAEIPNKHKFAIAILFGTIFVARSPSSAIAVINEMRASGPFTKTVMGVTVVKDVLVIILFAISFALAKAFINEETIGFTFLVFLFIELLVSFGLGFLLGKLLSISLTEKISEKLKIVFILLFGFGIYLFADLIKHYSVKIIHHEFIIEPLLICIIGSFYVTNYSKHKIEFAELLEKISPTIYIIFFTLTGASLSLHTLISVFNIAIILFFLRLITMYLGGVFGVTIAKDKKKYTHIAWMPYLTQAGVALGLATLISNEFPTWGHQFETIVIAIIVINQLVGPPLFKWALNFVNESHLKAKMDLEKNSRDAVIFGIENQSIALSNQLNKHHWKTRMVCVDNQLTNKNKESNQEYINFDTNKSTLTNLQWMELEKVEAVVLMLNDEQNYNIAETIYENFGTKEVVVRLNNRKNFDKFHQLGCLIIEPSTAIVSLLDHFVRSPNATSLLLGIDEGQDTLDITIKNKDYVGLQIRELRLPSDIIILSIKRNNQLLITHGYTTLRMNDVVTLVGSDDSLESLKYKMTS